VRSGRAYGGLTSVLATDPRIFFVGRKQPENTFDLLNVKLRDESVHDELNEIVKVVGARRRGHQVHPSGETRRLNGFASSKAQ
jgi:hypothetical protein